MKKNACSGLYSFGAVTAALFACGNVRGEDPNDVWACRPSHPAVVNSVLGIENSLSLRGEWQFVTNRLQARHTSVSPASPSGPGNGVWWTRPDARTINVPGCWEAQGVGAPGKSSGWSCWWDYSPKPFRHVFVGEGWYRKAVVIPESWKGRRVWLKIGGANAQGWFWVNGERVAWSYAYCGTYKYEITDLVRPGETAWVIAHVANGIPTRRGCMAGVNNYGGLIRDVELEATPRAFIDDAWVRGDFDGRRALVNVALSGLAAGRAYTVRATVEGKSVSRAATADGTVTLAVPLADFRAWSPETPELYVADITLFENDAVSQIRRERFGVRKFETRGDRFFLNDRPFFLRGAGWHWIWPHEGLPPPDRRLFLSRAKLIRAAGFNLVRTHTSCHFPEFFEAADEAGLMVEPELPYYQDVPTHYQPFDPVRDMKELVANYRRYPSFCVLSGGNEGWFGAALSKRLYDEFKALAPDRLMIGHDRWYDPDLHQAGTSDYQGGPMTVWPRGAVKTPTPFVAHEYLNLCVKLDSRLENRFTGVWRPPTTRAARAAWLATNGLDLVRGDRLQEAQHVMQKTWRKYGFESARADPHCAGYSYWSLQDSCSPQKGAYSGQALFNPFWEAKARGDTAASVAVYNSGACLLFDDGDDARVYAKDPRKSPGGFDLFVTPGITNRVRRSGDRIDARFRLAHFGERPFGAARLTWRLVTAERTLLAASREVGDQALGGVRELAAATVVLPDVDRPVKAVLEAELRDGRTAARVANSWEYWIFPRARPLDLAGVAADETARAALAPRSKGLLAAADAARAKTVLAAAGSPEAAAAVRRGQNLVTYANLSGPPNILLGWWWMGTQMGAVLENHPMLAGLPHEGVLTPLLFRIVREGTPLPKAGVPADELVVYGEGGDCCYLYLSEKKRPDGARTVTVSGLDILSPTPEGEALLKGILAELAK